MFVTLPRLASRAFATRMALIGIVMGTMAMAGAPARAGTIVVSGEWITLGDVLGDVGGASSVRIARAPEPGQTLSLDPNMVVRAAEGAGLVVDGAPEAALNVRRTTMAVSANGFTVGLPNGIGEPSLPGITPLPQTRAAIPQERTESAAKPTLDPDTVYVLTLARDVKRGDLIVEADIEWAEARGGRAPFGAADSMADLIGQEAKRDLRAGLAVRTSDVKTPSVVKKGERVLLVFEAMGLRVTTEGRAMTDAALGDQVRVMNLHSNRSIDAVATGPGKAHVSPPGQASGV
jgi:flagellar basal body P-ring formation protein FlgA